MVADRARMWRIVNVLDAARERSFHRVLEGEPFAAVVIDPRRELFGKGDR